MTLAIHAKQAGVAVTVGCVFPACVNMAAGAGTIIADGRECEPLRHKDAIVTFRQDPDEYREVV